MGWFPPLVFSIMVQNGISLAWGLTVVGSIFIISIFFLLLCASWENVVEEARAVVLDQKADEGEVMEKAENHDGVNDNGNSSPEGPEK